MNGSEAAIRSFVERLVPPLEGESGDWDAVLRAYQAAPANRSWRVLRPPRSRRVALVLTVVLLLGVGLALTALAGVFHGDGVKTGLARFGEWQRGVPGEPAPPDVESWLDEANKKAPLPLSGRTELRRVLSASVEGVRYDLYGLRSGDTICLRLFAMIPPGGYPPPLACTTVQALAAAPSVFLLRSEVSFGHKRALYPGEMPAWSRAMFGFVGSGIKKLGAISDRGSGAATVENNVFLYVLARPGDRELVRTLVASGPSGKQTRIAVPPGLVFSDSFGPSRPPPDLGGPTVIERFPTEGKIGWLERGEPRGEPLPSQIASGRQRGPGIISFGRMVQPEPRSTARVVIARSRLRERAGGSICVGSLRPLDNGTSWGCGGPSDSPLIGVVWGGDPGPFSTIVGAVSDDEASLELYTIGGQRLVPIRDNAFVAEIPRTVRFPEPPFKLVARDRQGKVIGIIPDQGFGTRRERPLPGERHTLLRVTGAGGAEAHLDVAPSNLGGTCFWLDLGEQPEQLGCKGDFTPPPPALLYPVTDEKEGPVLFGAVQDAVRSLAIRLPSGRELAVPVVEGFVLYRVPGEARAEGALLLARDAVGRVIQRMNPATGQTILPAPEGRPIQRATKSGVQVLAFADGTIVVDTRVARGQARLLLGHPRVPFTCYRIRWANGRWKASGWAVYAETGKRFLTSLGPKPPYAACTLDAMHGHRWRDRFGTRHAVEIAFTAEARLYFDERATARDLALFLKTPALRKLRADPGTVPASTEIAARFAGGQVIPLTSRDADPPLGKVGIWTAGRKMLVVEITPEGRRLFVQLVRGRIVRANIHDLTPLN